MKISIQTYIYFCAKTIFIQSKNKKKHKQQKIKRIKKKYTHDRQFPKETSFKNIALK